MTQIPAGWYPDPAQTHPGRQRYWDGAQWTAHVHDPEPLQPYQPYQPYGQAPAYAAAAATTPDGVPLASWGRRAGAFLIDGAIQFALCLVIYVPLVLVNLDRMREFGDRLDAWSQQAEPGSLPFSTYEPLLPVFVEMGVASLLVGAVYTMGFWRWKQATPGKLALGLRIRRRESPDLPWSAILLRYGFHLAVGLIGLVPLVGFASSLVQLLDYLWPLWDDKRQALHDKVAGTNVVHPARQQEPMAAAASANLPSAW